MFHICYGIAIGEQSSLEGTINLLECTNQIISKWTKIFPFTLIGLGWSLKKGFTKILCPNNFKFAQIYFKRGSDPRPLPVSMPMCYRLDLKLIET